MIFKILTSLENSLTFRYADNKFQKIFGIIQSSLETGMLLAQSLKEFKES